MSASLAELLLAFRSASRLSQEALAERAGLSTRTISDIETGTAQAPRLITIVLLADAMSLTEGDRLRLTEAARKPGRRKRGDGAPVQTAQPPPLIGRSHDIERLKALIAARHARLVTLSGPAGVGKTSLATRIASDSAADFVDGCVIVELAPLRDASRVPEAVAQTLGVRESGDAGIADSVVAFLRERNMLIVLDNLEHLAPAAEWIGALIDACSGITVLTTSREPLYLRTEHVYAVAPLGSDAAARLFVDRAHMVRPDLSDLGSDPAVDLIVEHLDGLPLAIELAAPQLLLLPPKALAARLERRLPLLGNVARDRPERQRTMRDAIAWSYDLLSPPQQRLFRQISVLQGGGSFDTIAAIAGEGGDEPLLRQIAPLVQKNVIALTEDDQGNLRVSMLEMLREFGLERLETAHEVQEVRDRHARFFAELAESGEARLSGAQQRTWLQTLQVEAANTRSALEWLAQTRQLTLGFRLIAAFWRYWWLGGHHTEGLRYIAEFIALHETDAQSVATETYAKVLRARAVLLTTLGHFDEALSACNDAIALQRAGRDQAGLAASLTSLGIVYQYRGQYDASLEAHCEALALRERSGEELGVATSLSNLSSIAFSRGDLAAAAEFGERSAAIYRTLGHGTGLAHALMKLGLVAGRRQDYAGAEQFFQECLRLQRELGDVGSMHYSLVNLGAAAHHRGEYALALQRYGDALDILEAAPNRAALVKTLEDVAATDAIIGDAARGARIFSAAAALRAAIGAAVFASEEPDYEATRESIRKRLGEAAFDVQWQIGAGMPHERTLQEAREACSGARVGEGASTRTAGKGKSR